ncbi:hypothetical protein M758_9G123700 [Ceratodon purpureus]|nr:hypothetical protein M758_9G123700 [Ceratodon purpureus]
MSRSLESRSRQNLKLEPNVDGVTQTTSDTFEIADKLQTLHLGDHRKATKMTRHLKSDVLERRPRKSRWGIRVRRRRVKLQVSPLLGYLRGFLQSCTYTARSASTSAYRMDPRLPGSKLGLLLAKLQFSSKRARRIHSIQASYESYEQAQPLLDSNPSIL